MFNLKFDLLLNEINNYNLELKCLYILQYFEKYNDNIIIVTSNLYEANKFYQGLSNYTSDVLLFPMDDFLTSEALAISPEFKTTRLETLYELNNNKKIVVTNLMGYLRFIPTKEVIMKYIIDLNINDEIDILELSEQLQNLGYNKETIVNKTGEYALRGYVIDIFPISEQNPIRIEFFGNQIESIRLFDVNTQLTIKKIEKIKIKSNTEFINNPSNLEPYRNINNYISTTNISNYSLSTVFFDNYDDIKILYNKLLEEMLNYCNDIGLESNTIFMNSLDIPNKKIKYFNSLNNLDSSNYNNNYLKFSDIKDINNHLNKYIKNNKTVIICLSHKNLINKILNELNNNNVIFTNINNIFSKKINLVIKNITKGFTFENIVVISENEMFNSNNNEKIYKTNFSIGTKIRDISKLQIGDYVVHQKHGIGRYNGITTLTKNNLKKDYITIEYKDNDKLYIPVEKIDLITKYSDADSLCPKLNKLGGTEWIKTKIKAKQKAKEMADKLLKIYAERQNSKGYAFKKDNDLQIEFEKEFIYKETVDQIKVVEEIKKDMESSIPMDRLLCGDVGYGKTEIAFRAMFKAICSGKQVALLCPTTILSQQHYQNALERFKSFPVNICILNRFVSQSVIKENIKKIHSGLIDIVIGTHRLLSDDIKFNNLGLLIIDEEQRFGVKHKEKIKSYKNNIDILTLSATPIPRTLQMSMTGLRSLSLLETPPSNRYPIQTYVLKNNNIIIKDSIEKELFRGGQVFILYNNVSKIKDKYTEIKNLVPNAKIVIAHGKMDKNELEDIMYSFINKEYDILLCTTIIETGIDIPNVNTLIILDANNFGLSQLYQIRGRVGRTNKIAYCYLMYDQNKILSEQAIKRLNVIKEFTELGSGFSIAMRDLSIRGAGSLLGSEQSGFIDSIGIEMFIKMLNEEIDILNGKKIYHEDEEKPLLEVSTSIDDKYVKEVELKIEIHRMINSIKNYQDLKTVSQEIEDRFGKTPDNLIIYMYEEWFEKEAKELGINEIKQTKNQIEIYIPKEMLNELDGQKLFNELYKTCKYFRFTSHLKKTYIVLDIIRLDRHYIYYLIELVKIIKESKKIV